MDCLFNSRIPDSTTSELVFKPASKTFVTGIASSYDFYYDQTVLGQYIKESQFNYLVNSINEELIRYWPCTLCFACGYLCSPCTLGLSFLCPYGCIMSAKENLLTKIEHFNSQHFEPKGLIMLYHQTCSTSWITLSVNKNKKLSLCTIKTGTTQISKKMEKEFEFGSQVEFNLRSVDSQLKVDLLK